MTHQPQEHAGQWLSPVQASDAIGASLKKLNTLARHGCLAQFLGDDYRETKLPGHPVYWEIHADALTSTTTYIMLTGSVNPASWGTGWRPQIRAQANQAIDKATTLRTRLQQRPVERSTPAP